MKRVNFLQNKCINIKYYNVINKLFSSKITHNSEFSSNDTNEINTESIVTPFEVKGHINYDNLISKFGTEKLTPETIELFNNSFNTKHHWLNRQLFYTHRGFDYFIKSYLNGEKVFLYTGRGPSTNSMHLGHLIPFIFCSYLQKIFKNCPLIIQIADEEKAALKILKDKNNKPLSFRDNFDLIYKHGIDNAKEIIAIGDFNHKNTFIFSNRNFRLENKEFELQATYMKNIVSIKEIKKIFGFIDEDNMSVYEWPFYQAVASFSDSYGMLLNEEINKKSNLTQDIKNKYKCLIPHAIDQDPYFRLTRDIANKLNQNKPCNIMSKFLPPLSGVNGKMSSSSNITNNLKANSINMDCIFLNDSPKIIKKKIMNAYSGGGGDGSLGDHVKYGGNPDLDIAYKYLEIFEESDEKLENIRNDFIKGTLSCGGIKSYLSEIIINLIEGIKEKKDKIKDEDVLKFYDSNRKLY